MALIARHPLPTVQGPELDWSGTLLGITSGLASPRIWPVLDEALQAALFERDGSALQRLASGAGGASSPGAEDGGTQFEAQTVIECLDDPWAVPIDLTDQYVPAITRASPTLGRYLVPDLAMCEGFPFPDARPISEMDFDAAGAAPIVVIGSTGDPTTPYQWSVALADTLESAVLVTRRGDGHTSYGQGNSCVDASVHAFLLGGTVPDEGLMC